MEPSETGYLGGLGDAPEWYRARLAEAQTFAVRLPLVRVGVPASGARYQTEFDDLLDVGVLRATHKSPRSRAIEERLGATDALYLHAGRGHPAYGTCVFVLADVDGAEASPGGLGSLLCERGASVDDGEVHDGCLAPIAHCDEASQRRYYVETTWRGVWRAPAGCFIAGYFGDVARGGFSSYFHEGDDGRPHHPDPYGVFTNPKVTDWRAWTLEVRVAGDVDLHRALDEDRLLAWGMTDDLRRRADERLADGGSCRFFLRLRTRAAELKLGDDFQDGARVVRASDEFVRRWVEP
ncbi:MAG: hypothetical protein R3A52_24795 [Polyangiales bacterium]